MQLPTLAPKRAIAAERNRRWMQPMRVHRQRLLAFAALAALGACVAPQGQDGAARGLAGSYSSVTPARSGTLDLYANGVFYLRLPAGLLDEGAPFLATGKWRPRVDEWSDMDALRPLVVLVVAEWGVVGDWEGEYTGLEIPLYWHADGLALMSPCMTWVFKARDAGYGPSNATQLRTDAPGDAGC